MTRGKLLCLSELPASTDSTEPQLLTRRLWAGKEQGLVFQGRAAGSTCYQEEVDSSPLDHQRSPWLSFLSGKEKWRAEVEEVRRPT